MLWSPNRKKMREMHQIRFALLADTLLCFFCNHPNPFVETNVCGENKQLKKRSM